MAVTPSYHGNFTDEEQPTLLKVSDYVADARTQLQDTIAPYRYSDASMLVALNVTMLEASRLRPDLFIWNNYGGQVQSFEAVDDTPVDMEVQFRLAILHGVIGHALKRDQEDVQDSRASSYLAMFTQGLVGHGVGPVQGGSPPQNRRDRR